MNLIFAIQKKVFVRVVQNKVFVRVVLVCVFCFVFFVERGCIDDDYCR